jgi:hypothetical protein
MEALAGPRSTGIEKIIKINAFFKRELFLWDVMGTSLSCVKEDKA